MPCATRCGLWLIIMRSQAPCVKNGQAFQQSWHSDHPKGLREFPGFSQDHFSQRWIPKSQFWYPLLRLGSRLWIPKPRPGLVWGRGSRAQGPRALFELRKEQVTSTGQKGYLRTSKTEFSGFSSCRGVWQGRNSRRR